MAANPLDYGPLKTTGPQDVAYLEGLSAQTGGTKPTTAEMLAYQKRLAEEKARGFEKDVSYSLEQSAGRQMSDSEIRQALTEWSKGSLDKERSKSIADKLNQMSEARKAAVWKATPKEVTSKFDAFMERMKKK
jgi:hypothetical protein